MSEVRLLYRPPETKALLRSAFVIYGEAIEESKDGATVSPAGETASRGREILLVATSKIFVTDSSIAHKNEDSFRGVFIICSKSQNSLGCTHCTLSSVG